MRHKPHRLAFMPDPDQGEVAEEGEAVGVARTEGHRFEYSTLAVDIAEFAAAGIEQPQGS